MKIYYAHFIGIYSTLQEERDLNIIKAIFPEAEIYNPNNSEAQQGYKERGMDYFLDIIVNCDLLIFRGLPNMKIPAGVYKEIECAITNLVPVIELPCLTERKMSVEDTRQFLKEIGSR
jgi:hypothetical protein